jgi:hypothetical protein
MNVEMIQGLRKGCAIRSASGRESIVRHFVLKYLTYYSQLNLDVHTLSEFNDVFARRPKGGQSGVYSIATTLFNCNPDDLAILSQAEDPDMRITITHPDDKAEVLAAYIPDVMSPDTAKHIAEEYGKLTKVLPKSPDGDYKGGVPRHYACARDVARTSGSPAFHFGFWETYGSIPRFTKATVDQYPLALERINSLMYQIKNYLAPHFMNILSQHFPEQVAAMIK